MSYGIDLGVIRFCGLNVHATYEVSITYGSKVMTRDNLRHKQGNSMSYGIDLGVIRFCGLNVHATYEVSITYGSKVMARNNLRHKQGNF